MAGPTAMERRVTAQFVQKGDVGAVYGGVEIEGNVNVETALKLGGLDWECRLREICMADKARTKIPGYFATYRSDTNEPLGIVKSRYVPMQNRDAFSWAERLLGEGEAFVETAGCLHGGRQTFICLDMGGFEVVPGDKVRKHMLILNSHDGTSNLVVMWLPHRLYCQNILNFHPAQMSEFSFTGPVYRIRHTGGATVKLDEIHRIIALSNAAFTEAEETFSKFAATRIDIEQQNRIIYSVLKVPAKQLSDWKKGKLAKQPQWVKQFTEIEAVGQFAPGSDVAEGTVWHTYNAITGYFDHMRTVRGAEAKPDNAIESSISGYSAKMKMQAYDVCHKFVETGKV